MRSRSPRATSAMASGMESSGGQTPAAAAFCSVNLSCARGIGRWSGSAVLRLTNDIHDQDKKFGLDGMTVTSEHEYRVIDQRIADEQPEEEPRPGNMIAQSADQSPDRENGRREVQGVSEQGKA